VNDDLYFLQDVPPDREPEQATALALLRAYGQQDGEAVAAIVNSTDPARLCAVMTGLAWLLGEALYGGHDELEEALQSWLTIGDLPPS
jgi:hypothetical protein